MWNDIINVCINDNVCVMCVMCVIMCVIVMVI